MKLVFASNNPHKLQEVRHILPHNIEVLSLRDIGFLYDIAETGTTLEQNSALKAQAVFHFLNQQSKLSLIDGVFADDTGLEITALHGVPGIVTARWAGEPANDANNRHKALTLLQGVSDRTAQFRTVITYITAFGEERQTEGIVRGTIALSESGERGFGYDSIFIPEGYDRTFAQLPEEVKDAISHRAKALQAFCRIL